MHRFWIVFVAACATEPDVASFEPVALAMPIGAVIEHDRFADPNGNGRADNFANTVDESGKSRNVRYGVDANNDQRISVSLAQCPAVPGPCGFGTNGDGRASLIEVTREASPGEYYKGWMAGRTVNSNNNGSGLCEDDSKASPGREQFRAQLKIWFLDDDLEVAGSCYCNVCPRETGEPVISKCNTAQWAIQTTLSDDGACKAPPRTRRVRFAVTGLARDRQPTFAGTLEGPEATGTAVFDRFVFARCGADGNCDAQNILDATRWY
ncbi:MAG: hypothetical protein ABI867_21990 [Kofleriaceae bacterium]